MSRHGNETSATHTLPVPKPPELWTLDEGEEVIDELLEMKAAVNPDFMPSTSSDPHLICHAKLNDLVREVSLSKSQEEILGSRLQGWNLLLPELFGSILLSVPVACIFTAVFFDARLSDQAQNNEI